MKADKEAEKPVRIKPPPATGELLKYWRDHWPIESKGDEDWLASLLEAFDSEWREIMAKGGG